MRHFPVLFTTLTTSSKDADNCSHPTPIPHPACGAALSDPQAVDDPDRLADNPHPKWAVPHELIEWQPAYAQQGAITACILRCWQL